MRRIILCDIVLASTTSSSPNECCPHVFERHSWDLRTQLSSYSVTVRNHSEHEQHHSLAELGHIYDI
jgi:hypothetical protein